MFESKDYKFEVSLSVESFENKEISGAMIGSGKDDKVRKIRKDYGYKSTRGVSYKRVSITSSELMNRLITGSVFCHLFNPDKTRTDNTFGASSKKDANFCGSWVIGIDIDKTNYNTVEDFINTLSLKPTFYYTTYSNLQDNKGARFRLIYVLDQLLERPLVFRYAATKLNEIIIRDSNEDIYDDCNLRCSQYFNGTNINNPDIIASYGCSDNIYSFSDFGCTADGYVDFLNNNANYKSITKKVKERIREELTKISKCVDVQSHQHYTISEMEKMPQCSDKLIGLLKSYSYDDFMKFNRKNYTYFWKPEVNWINGKFAVIDENYFELPYTLNDFRFKDGQQRRQKIFNRARLRRLMRPDVDADTLLFNAYEDVHRFFDNSDGILSIDVLVDKINTAMTYTEDEIRKDCSLLIEMFRGNNPKKGIIYNTDSSMSQAEKNSLRKEATYYFLDMFYDRNMTVKENLEQNFGKIGKSTVYEYCKVRGIKFSNDEQIKAVLDITKGYRDNVVIVKKCGLKAGEKKIKKLLKELRQNFPTNDCVELSAAQQQHTISEMEKVPQLNGFDFTVPDFYSISMDNVEVVDSITNNFEWNYNYSWV